MNATLRMVEHDSQEWHEAWKGLRRLGHNLDDYMLMYAMDDSVYFKHIITRQYTTVRLAK